MYNFQNENELKFKFDVNSMSPKQNLEFKYSPKYLELQYPQNVLTNALFTQESFEKMFLIYWNIKWRNKTLIWKEKILCHVDKWMQCLWIWNRFYIWDYKCTYKKCIFWFPFYCLRKFKEFVNRNVLYNWLWCFHAKYWKRKFVYSY